jgi:uncharacterized protein
MLGLHMSTKPIAEQHAAAAGPSAPPSGRTRVRRMPARARYEREIVEAILDEALVAHLAFTHDGQPYAIPTLQARVGDTVYVHGSAASRMIRTLAAGAPPACLTVTLLDGLVLARSAAHQSVNYRSAMILGGARLLQEESEKLLALERFTERIVPGRWAEVRPPTAKELKGVSVLAMSLRECSAKVRSGPPLDDPPDLPLEVWAGVVPLRLAAGTPQPDPQLREGIALSPAVRRWARERP